MNAPSLAILSSLLKRFPWLDTEERAIDILTAFVRDTEHDVISVATALQAHVDLLHDELVRNRMPVDRFAALSRAIARVVADITVLASISELVQTPRSDKTPLLAELMREISEDTSTAFIKSQVSLSFDVTAGTTLIGNARQLKDMITGMVLAVLRTCHELETVRIVGRTHGKHVSLTFNTGSEVREAAFKPWRLGELRLIPTNGEGISLAAVDAMARVHQGRLSVSTLSNKRHGYKLTFKV